MASLLHVCFVCLLSALTIIPVIHGIKYRVSYIATDDVVERFKRIAGVDFAISTMKEATKFIQEQVLEQPSRYNTKHVRKIELVIDQEMQGHSWHRQSFSNRNHYFIQIGATLVAESHESRLKIRLKRLIYVETACILQWAREGDILQDYISYYILLKKEIQVSEWVPVKEGDKWNSGIEIAGQFLDFCDKRKHGFVPFLNDKMRLHRFKESFFEEFLGEKIDVLWKAYKEEYGGDGDKA